MHEHMERFDDIALRVLRSLYATFPVASAPTPKTIGMTDEVPVFANGRLNTSDEWRSVADEISSALQWLAFEDLVYVLNRPSGPTHLLTSKGFRTLGKLDSGMLGPRVS